jgi:hypothetical protein
MNVGLVKIPEENCDGYTSEGVEGASAVLKSHVSEKTLVPPRFDALTLQK